MVFFANLRVNPRGSLCNVLAYASAQPLDFLDLGKKSSILGWKRLASRLEEMDGHYSLFTRCKIWRFAAGCTCRQPIFIGRHYHDFEWMELNSKI